VDQQRKEDKEGRKQNEQSCGDGCRAQYVHVLNIKGLGHEISICLMACKIKEVLSIYALMVTGNFYAFLLSKLKSKFLLASTV
jgi:hypothetical protein